MVHLICRKVIEAFWNVVLKASYYVGKLDSPSPGRTNVKVALDLNHYAIRRLWSVHDYKVVWLFNLVRKRQRGEFCSFLFGDPNMR